MCSLERFYPVVRYYFDYRNKILIFFKRRVFFFLSLSFIFKFIFFFLSSPILHAFEFLSFQFIFLRFLFLILFLFFHKYCNSKRSKTWNKKKNYDDDGVMMMFKA